MMSKKTIKIVTITIIIAMVGTTLLAAIVYL